MKHPRGHPFLLMAAITLAAPYHSLAQPADSGSSSAQLDEVKRSRLQAFDIIAHHYVDAVTIDSSLPLPVVVRRLDPFSYYLTNADYILSQRRDNDEQYKYGLSVRSSGGHVVLTAIVPGGAADRAGIWPGDEVRTIGKEALHGNDSLAHQLFFTNDSLDLTLFRESSNHTWRTVLHRALLRVSSVPIAIMITSEIGYISITAFHHGTSDSLHKAVDYLAGRGMRALIIDVRWNPGGLVTETLKALNIFVGSLAPVITETSVIPMQYEARYLRDEPAYPNLPLAVLVNNSSCSASEFFAGTLQDYDRAVIIGEPTIGKSLVMRSFQLPDSDWLYLAIARYALPSGRWVQRPYSNGQLIGGEWRDYANFDNSAHTFDSDLAEAECPVYKTQAGRSVTGLTGIVPDYFVSQMGFYPDWLRDGVEAAAGSYLRCNAGWLKHTTLDSFARYCTMPEAIISPVLDTIRAHDTTAEKLLSAQFAWMVPKIIKADVAYGVWDKCGFFTLWERNSATVRRAVELLSQPAVPALVVKN